MFHPGDALTVPEDRVPVLLLPLVGPWLKTSEMIDYAREVAPQRAYAIHDAILNANGIGLMERMLGVAAAPTGRAVRPAGPGHHGRSLGPWLEPGSPVTSRTPGCLAGAGSRQRLVIGRRRSRPKFFGVIFGPGGYCRRLYSARSTSRITRSTSAGSWPAATSSAAPMSCST